MAAIVQQSTGVSAARAFWNAKMAAHPNLAGGLAIAGSVAGFFLNGHALIRFGQWVVRVTGSIAETALLFAVLWISGTSVAPSLIELVMSAQTMQYFVSVALLALALIPEIILGNAIVNALSHVQTATQQRTPVAWAWAGLFVLPTVLFLWLTAYTLNTLVANGGNFVQASAGLVGLRCFAGWTYGLLAVVYAGIGRRTLNQPVALAVTPAQPVPPPQPIDYQEIASLLLPLVAQAVPDTTGMVEQLQQLRVELEALTQRITPPSEAINETNHETIDETNITLFEDAKFHLKQKIDETNQETEMETEEVLTPRITRKLKQERRPTKKASSVETKSETNNARGTARQKALRVLKRNPEISVADLATRAKITPQYAGQIMKQQ